MTPTPAPSPVTPSAVHSRKAALTLLFLLSLVWGVHWAVVKQGLDYMPPLQYAALRLIAGLLTMLAILGVQGRIRRPPRSDVPIVLSVGIFQIGAGRPDHEPGPPGGAGRPLVGAAVRDAALGGRAHVAVLPDRCPAATRWSDSSSG